MSEVEAVLVVVVILASSVISHCIGFSDGYKFGRDIGRAEGVGYGLRRANIKMRKGSDAE